MVGEKYFEFNFVSFFKMKIELYYVHVYYEH